MWVRWEAVGAAEGWAGPGFGYWCWAGEPGVYVASAG